MLNRITLMGRLTRDPELRYTQSEIPVARFSLAVERNYANDGKRETDFFDVVAWRGTGEFVSKYFTKGQLVCVEGRLQRRLWKDKDGNNRYAFEVIAESAYFAGAKKHNESAGEPDGFDPFFESAAA